MDIHCKSDPFSAMHRESRRSVPSLIVFCVERLFIVLFEINRVCVVGKIVSVFRFDSGTACFRLHLMSGFTCAIVSVVSYLDTF